MWYAWTSWSGVMDLHWGQKVIMGLLDKDSVHLATAMQLA